MDDKELTKEEQRQKDLERLAKLRPLDDTFMRELFRNDMPLAQYVLRIITGKQDLVLTSSETQYDLHNLSGARGLTLDLLGVDSLNRLYNLEVQCDLSAAPPKRLRYHSSGLDIEFLAKGEPFDNLPITYVIFITETDPFGKGLPLYPIERINTATGEPFGDDEHILYVNGAYTKEGDDSELAKLIHDFRCSKADDMLLPQMAEKTRYFKENDKGVSHMCRIMEEMTNEAEKRAKLSEKTQIAISLLKRGRDSVEEIADLTRLPIEKVKELAEQIKPASA